MLRFGNVEVALISDGRFKQDAGILFGIIPRVLWGRTYTPDEQNRLGMALNSLVIRSQGKTILVETGFGTKLTSRQVTNFALDREKTDLVGDLGALGLRPEDIDIVINSHLHLDHSGGNTKLDGDRLVPTFPRAEYWIQRREWEDALHPNVRTRATYFAENMLPLQETGQLKLIEGTAAVTDEVTCELALGHSAGHQVVWVASQGQSAVCIGDMAQVKEHMERIAWMTAFDIEPIVSLETKQHLLDRAARDGSALIFVHDDIVAGVETAGDSFKLVPWG